MTWGFFVWRGRGRGHTIISKYKYVRQCQKLFTSVVKIMVNNVLMSWK